MASRRRDGRETMAVAEEAVGEGSRLLKPSGSPAKKVSPTEDQELGGGVRTEVAAIENVEGLVEKR